jgi:hypothetical protein
MHRAPLSVEILTPLVTPDLPGVKAIRKFHIYGLTFGFSFFLILFLELLNLYHNAIQELRLNIFFISKSILELNKSIMLFQTTKIQKLECPELGEDMCRAENKRYNSSSPNNIEHEL